MWSLRNSARPLGLAGDILSLLGLVMMLFSGYVVWQEGTTALFVTLNPNPGSYERRLGRASQRPAPERAALLGELYRYTPTPQPTPLPTPTLQPTHDSAPPPVVAHSTPTMQAPGVPLPTLTPMPTPLPPPGSEPPVRLLIPSIGVDTAIVGVNLTMIDHNGVISREWETTEYGAGHHVGSANPGSQGNVVISGHNNIFGRVFRLLERVKPEDEIILETGSGQRYRYVVVEQLIVPETGVSQARRQENAAYMAPTEDYRVTLISCWPYWTNTHRVIVVAELVA